jgi:hypothetical protein
VIAGLKAKLQHTRGLISVLLSNAGESGTCKECKARVIFVRHVKTGRSGIYDADGRSHFITCTNPERFRRKPQPNASYDATAKESTHA